MFNFDVLCLNTNSISIPGVENRICVILHDFLFTLIHVILSDLFHQGDVHAFACDFAIGFFAVYVVGAFLIPCHFFFDSAF